MDNTKTTLNEKHKGLLNNILNNPENYNLSNWEKTFIRSILRTNMISSKQVEIIKRIYVYS